MPASPVISTVWRSPAAARARASRNAATGAARPISVEPTSGTGAVGAAVASSATKR